MNYSVDMPYPKVQVEKKDICLAKKIMNVYAGILSEDTCIHTYIYQKLVLEENEDIKRILHGIAVVEMHHLEILGKLIMELGLTPLFASVENDTLKWFSGDYVIYNKNIKEILLSNIEQEEKVIKGYEDIIASTSDECVRHILKRIILDEKLHIEIFSKLYQQLK